jgi:hypothetical protein
MGVQIPYGKWEHADLGLVLDIDPEFEPEMWRQFRGTYVEDGEAIDIIISISGIAESLGIWRAADVPDLDVQTTAPELYGGIYRQLGDKLLLRLNSLHRERTGLDTFVLERIAEYETP